MFEDISHWMSMMDAQGRGSGRCVSPASLVPAINDARYECAAQFTARSSAFFLGFLTSTSVWCWQGESKRLTAGRRRCRQQARRTF